MGFSFPFHSSIFIQNMDMNKLLLLIILLLGLISCDNESDLQEEPDVLSPFEQLCADFNNNEQITCKLIKETDSIITFSGLNQGYIWYAEYDANTLSKIYEWKDDVITDSVVRFYLSYSSDYTEPHRIYDILPNFHVKTEKGEIHSFFFNSTVTENPYIMRFGYQTIFAGSPYNKRTRIENSAEPDYQNAYNKPIFWYDDSYLIASSIFTISGDSLYGNKTLYQYVLNSNVRVVSYEEVVNIDNKDRFSGIGRFNLKKQENVWGVSASSVYEYLNIDTNLITDVNVRDSVEFVNTDSNIWNFKLVIDVWGQGKSEYLFKIDIETGEIVA